MKDKIVCRVLTGPTASGKTALSLTLAERNGWEILCMDSMQIYRRMDIGTAKPSAEERRRVPHHMIDIVEPAESFSAAEYKERAETLVREKREKEGKDVLFVGGTGLYLWAMTHSASMGAVPADEGLRAELKAAAEEPGGKKRLHDMLERIDPETAARLPENDVRRVIRALEVTRLTGVPFSRQPRAEEESPFVWRIAALTLPRDILYARINRRVDEMIRLGLREEVRELLAEGVPPDAQSMQGLGYKEMIPHLRGERTLEKAVEEIQKGSRHYAKRQETFLRRDPAPARVDALAPDAAEQLERIFSTDGQG